jgi:PAS domain S-box-containing protein
MPTNMPTKVLVVEDEPDLELLINLKFRRRIRTGELQFLFAHNGVEALKQLETNPDVSVVLSDIRMPEMDGLTLLTELNVRHPLLRTIIVSAYGDMHNIRTAMNRGAYDFLTKPVDFADLEATLDKTIRHVQQFMSEIEERKCIERQLLQLKKAVETMKLGVTIADIEGNIIYTNPAEAQMHGYEVTELIGNDVRTFAPPEIRKPVTLDQIKQWTGLVRESVNIRKDGSIFPVWLMSEIVRDVDGEPTAIVTSCEDITERKQAEAELRKHRDHLEELVKDRTMELMTINEALQQEIAERKKVEEALRESEEQYRMLFENLQDVFYRVDLTGKILLVSPSINQFLGYTEEEAIGLNLAKDVFADPNKWTEFMALMEKNGYINGFEVLLKQRDGSLEWGSASAQYYSDKEGHILGIEGIIQDINARKQAEAELLEKHKQLQELNASKDRFFSIISHDLKNPFNTILGFAELIETNIDKYSKPELLYRIQRIKTSTEKLYALLENLLTWSRIQRGVIPFTPEVINLFELVEENIAIFTLRAEHKNITLRSSIQQGTLVYADYSMVSTVVRNLLSNALKFTNPNGTIMISAIVRDHQVEVLVSDTGCGIPEDGLVKLFRIDTRYTGVGTAGEEGTGLGLILCKELVEQNSGTLWVESVVGKGTTFRFTLPRPPEMDQMNAI